MNKKPAKTLIVLYLLVSTLSVLRVPAYSQIRGCKITFDSTVTVINGRSNASSVRPGDTICLQGGKRTLLLISFLHGTKNKPIVIINRGGLVSSINPSNYGIKFDSCSNIKFSGRGHQSLLYGFRVYNAPGAGLSVDGLTTDIEIENIEIGKVGLAGIFAKTEPSEPNCTFKATREKFVLRNLKIHHCYIYETGMEGLYIGSSKYSGQTVTGCGKDTTVLPHLLRGVEIYNNIVSHAGWDGIQVSSSDSSCSVHDNTVLFDSQSEVQYQMSGILLGGGTNGKCYNNTIQDGKGDGIDVVTMGSQYVYNNLIINAGRTYKPAQNVSPYLKSGIYVSSSFGASTNKYILAFNTIVSPKSYGVKFDDNKSSNNHISDNILFNPGSFSTEGDKGYINLGSPPSQATTVNNLKSNDLNALSFVDPTQGNYDLKKNSPAVNNASAIEGFTLQSDLPGRVRPFALLSDIGAFECQDSSLLGSDERGDLLLHNLSVSPVPASDRIEVTFSLNNYSVIKLSLYACTGQLVYSSDLSTLRQGTQKIIVPVNTLQSGVYSLILQSNRNALVRKIVVINKYQ